MLVKLIVKKTGAYLVLSSSWKEVVRDPQCYNEPEKAFVGRLVNHSGLPFIDLTPDVDEFHREQEVQQWLNATTQEIESFVIIDDLPFEFPKKFPNQFVQTSGALRRGLTWKQAMKAIKILNRSSTV